MNLTFIVIALKKLLIINKKYCPLALVAGIALKRGRVCVIKLYGTSSNEISKSGISNHLTQTRTIHWAAKKFQFLTARAH